MSDDLHLNFRWRKVPRDCVVARENTVLGQALYTITRGFAFSRYVVSAAEDTNFFCGVAQFII